MHLKVTKWEDFNNLSVSLKIKRKKYNGIFLKKRDYLVLRIDITKEFDSWKNSSDDFPLLNGNLLYNDEKITFLNCMYNGCSSSFDSNGKTTNTVDYRIDRIIIGKKFTKEDYKNISCYKVEYNNIDCFTSMRPYTINYDTLESKGITNSYNLELNNMQISLYFSCDEKKSKNEFTLQRDTFVIFNHKKKINISKALENIYMFKNFLLLLLRKNIVVEKQYIIDEDNEYQLIDCFNIKVNENNDELEEYLYQRCIKIEKITNLNEVYLNYYDLYDKLTPLIELYYNVTQYNVPNLTRLVNAITMIEYYSRTFDFNSALSLTRKNKPKKDDPEYRCMLISLITNINSIYSYTEDEIETISGNIKKSRDRYIHYLSKTSTKYLSYNQQFWYSYFLQDVALLNVYKLLGLDITLYQNIIEDFYQKDNLI